MFDVKYPYIENSYEQLRDLCIEGINSQYDSEIRHAALDRMKNELTYVKMQDSASGYLFCRNILKSVNAKPEELMVRDNLSSSLIPFSLGISDLDPLSVVPVFYPEFYFGIDGNNKLYSFTFLVTHNLLQRLLIYLDENAGDYTVVRKYDLSGRVCGFYYGDIKEDDKNQLTVYNPYMLNVTVAHAKEVRKSLISGRVIDKVQPNSLAEYVKCASFERSEGSWENNAEVLYIERKVPFDELIATREDIYELLINHGVEQKMAFDISNDVGRGKVFKNGWTSEMIDLIEKSDIPDWFIVSCEKIKHLHNRPDIVMRYWKFCREVF